MWNGRVTCYCETPSTLFLRLNVSGSCRSVRYTSVTKGQAPIDKVSVGEVSATNKKDHRDSKKELW